MTSTRVTDNEFNAELLGSRVAAIPAYFRLFRAGELLAYLCAWGCVVAAIVLDGKADKFDPKLVLDELKPYAWSHTTVDTVVAAFIAAASGSLAALNCRPLLGFSISTAIAVVCIVKRVTLSEPAGNLRALSALFAAVSAGVIAAASLAQHMRSRRRQGSEVHLEVSDSEFGPQLTHYTHLEGYARRRHEAVRGASVGRLLSLARPERGLITLATICLAVSTFTTMAMPAMVGQLLSVITNGKHKDPHGELLQVTLLLIIIFAVGSIFVIFRTYLFTLAGERVVCRLRQALFAHMLSLDVAFFDESQVGELLNRLSSDTGVLQNAVTVNVSMALRFGAQIIISICIVFYIQWSLTLVMLSIVPVITIAAIIYARFVRRIAKRYQDLLAKASTVAQECIGSVRTVRSFGMETREAKEYAKAVHESFLQGRKRAMVYGVFGGALMMLGQSAVVLVLFYGGTLVINGNSGFDAGTLMSFLLYTIMIATALGALSDIFGSLMNAVGSSARIFGILDRRASIPSCEGDKPTDLRGVLQLREVSFAYPTRSDVLVLDRVNLTIQPGTVTALCGPSGSGKSSIIQLLERFYDPLQGSITVDGILLADLDATWWRRQAALVAQEPVLFARTVQENIAYGCKAVTDDAVIEAARIANAHDFVSSFPEGYNTAVGERGVQLSGGQKQRIAIARALLVDPRMLLLDEATSALDAESEHVVQEAIDRLMKNRTTVVVAHRLSTVRSADMIVVVQRGRIAERGSHDELVALDGVYHGLVRRQMASSPSDADMGGSIEDDRTATTAP